MYSIYTMGFQSDKVYIILLGLGIMTLLVHGTDFDRTLFGVEYMPYVKKPENGRHISESDYTLKNMKTMLEIVSTKFTKIITWTSGAQNVPHLNNATFYQNMNTRTKTAEAAALINCEKKNKSLSVFLSSYEWLSRSRAETELTKAVEAAYTANFIYPGTVEGIFLMNFRPYNFKRANLTLHRLQKLRNITADFGVKVGILATDQNLNLRQSKNESKDVWVLKQEIVLESDFIIYLTTPSSETTLLGVDYGFQEISSNALSFRREIAKLNNETDVMLFTYWMDNKNLKSYWEMANNFAIKERFPVWLSKAFDNPVSGLPNTGWWKLTHNDLINHFLGYVEKSSGNHVKISASSISECRNRNDSSDITSDVSNIISNVTKLPNDSNVFEYASDLPRNAISKDDEISESPEADQNYYMRGIATFVGGGCGVLFILALILYIIITRRKIRPTGILTRREIDEFKFGVLNSYHSLLEDGNSGNLPGLNLPYDIKLEIPKAKLHVFWDHILGGGQYGQVYKALIKGGAYQEVALKMAKGPTALRGLLSEIKILVYLGQHPNIVSICGAYTAEIEKDIVYLAIELCPLGSLKSYLRNFTKLTKDSDETIISRTLEVYNSISRFDLIRWSHEIACGMQYLEEKNVLHADLATRNVLLTSERTAKITDFGLSRRLYDYSNYTKESHEPLPWRWMAFESLRRTEFSIKSDIWSYGVTLWEIYTLGDTPFPERVWDEDFMKALENGLRLSQPDNASVEEYEIMESCWKLQPLERPCFAELCARTKLILDEAIVKPSELPERL